MNRNKRMTQCKFAIITAALLGSGSAISGGPPIPLPRRYRLPCGRRMRVSSWNRRFRRSYQGTIVYR